MDIIKINLIVRKGFTKNVILEELKRLEKKHQCIIEIKSEMNIDNLLKEQEGSSK